MIIIGILLTFVVLGFLCWVLFQLAVLALPFFAAVTVGTAVVHSGGGALAAFFLGLLAGILTLVVGQLVFTLVPSALVRGAVAIVFIVPAAVAGYHAAHGLMGMGTSSEAWRFAVGLFGGALVGTSALARLVIRVAPSTSSQLVPFSSGVRFRRYARQKRQHCYAVEAALERVASLASVGPTGLSPHASHAASADGLIWPRDVFASTA